MSYRYYPEFEPKSPIRPADGLRARSQRGEFVKNWWAAQWIKALEKLMDPGRLKRGRAYARAGQVRSLVETKTGVEARVQGSRPTPYKVTIRLDHFTAAQWEAVLDALASRALFAAQLLAGEMPLEIDEAFAAAGVSLFPNGIQQLHTECSCPDPANPCKHVAAAHYMLGEQLDEDPFLLFRLRGRDQDQILEALRARRTTSGLLQEEPAAYTVAPPVPLDADLEHFWQLGQTSHGPSQPVAIQIKRHHTPRPILKRLGQPAFLDLDLEQTLAPALDAITAAALTAAYGPDADASAPETAPASDRQST